MTVAQQKVTEADLLRTVVELAAWSGCLVHHCRPAFSIKGWRTPIQGDRGFPDLVIVHPRHGIVFVELKAVSGRLSGEQELWHLKLVGQNAMWACWTPNELDDIVAWFQDSRAPFPQANLLRSQR